MAMVVYGMTNHMPMYSFDVIYLHGLPGPCVYPRAEHTVCASVCTVAVQIV